LRKAGKQTLSLRNHVLVFQRSPDILNSKKTAPTNPRGIPFAPFVDKVEDYVSSRSDVEGCLKSFQEMIS